MQKVTQTAGIFLSAGRASLHGRGVDGALLDLEYERIELHKPHDPLPCAIISIWHFIGFPAMTLSNSPT